jgi:hypothetical protein
MTIKEALENALEFLESLGYTSGDIHDDLSLAKDRISRKYRNVADEVL